MRTLYRIEKLQRLPNNQGGTPESLNFRRKPLPGHRRFHPQPHLLSFGITTQSP